MADAVTLTLPPLAGVWEDAAGRPQPADVVTCDTDANDLFATCFLTALERARAVAPGKALILPERVEVWAALVCCPDLARLNRIDGPLGCGFDFSSLNRLCHRTRAVRLSRLPHRMLTRPTLALTAAPNEVTGRHPTTFLPLAVGAASARLEVIEGGEAHALLVWHTFRLSDEADLDDGDGSGTHHSVTTGPLGADPAAKQVRRGARLISVARLSPAERPLQSAPSFQMPPRLRMERVQPFTIGKSRFASPAKIACEDRLRRSPAKIACEDRLRASQCLRLSLLLAGGLLSVAGAA